MPGSFLVSWKCRAMGNMQISTWLPGGLPIVLDMLSHQLHVLHPQGFIDCDTGEVQMEFVAQFNFSAANLYKVRCTRLLKHGCPPCHRAVFLESFWLCIANVVGR